MKNPTQALNYRVSAENVFIDLTLLFHNLVTNLSFVSTFFFKKKLVIEKEARTQNAQNVAQFLKIK